MEKDCWGQIKSKLRSELGKDAYKNWIEPLTIASQSDQVVRFNAPTSFFGTWVARNYGDRIKTHFVALGVSVDRLEFDVVSGVKTQSNAAAPRSATPPRQSGQPHKGADLLAGTNLDPRCTFDNFVVGKPNEMAHAAARRAADIDTVAFNPLFLYGGVGLGKTHLMHAIAWEIQAKDPDKKVLFLSAEQFMYRFVQALRFKDTISFKQLFRSVDVLIVDDVQFIGGKDSTQDEFFHTFNALVDQNKQVIISADRAPGEIDGLEERIKSRLQWGLVVDLHPTDYELRLGILQSKAEQHALKNPEVVLNDGILEFMAHRLTGNVRHLEGALNRVYAFASFTGKAMTLEAAQECLSDILRNSEKKITVDTIIRKVADHYNVRMTDMLGPRRARSIARPRQIAMYLSKRLTTKSLPEIGRNFSNRDHTTVIHAVRKIEELRKIDSQIDEDVELLRRMLEA